MHIATPPFLRFTHGCQDAMPKDPKAPSRWADAVQLYPPRFRRGRIPHCALTGSAGLSSRRATKRLAGTCPSSQLVTASGVPVQRFARRRSVRAAGVTCLQRPAGLRHLHILQACAFIGLASVLQLCRILELRDDDERIWTAKSGTCGRLAAEELLRAFARRDRLRQGACVRVHTNCIVDFPCRGLEFRVPHDVNRRSVKLPRPERTGRCDETPRVESAVNRSATGCRAVPSRKWTDRNVPHVATSSAGAYRHRRNEIYIGGRGDRRVACLGGSRELGREGDALSHQCSSGSGLRREAVYAKGEHGDCKECGKVVARYGDQETSWRL
jgi:hypothetical protein